MADTVITSEVFVAYSQCPRKAFLLLFSNDQGTPHDYPRILKERRKVHQTKYLEAFKQLHENAKLYDEKNWKKDEIFVEATLKAECWKAYCDVLTKVEQSTSSRKVMYEATITVETYSITKEQKIELLFIGKVLGQIQKQLPAVGTIVGLDDKAHRVKLDSGYKSITPFLKKLQDWIEEKPAEPPVLILNKHCPSCQFRDLCREQAVKENSLSLLDRMTPKAIQKYNKKGIFTVHQLSYLFKPRRNRKRKTKPLVKHSLELQALAIREQKIYIQEFPELTRKSVELFLDIEGIPDQDFYYLMGLLVCEGENSFYYYFWADKSKSEKEIWEKLIEKLNEYSEAPIYHYGNYEAKAIDKLTKKYSTSSEKIKQRLININTYIYGKIYFPIFSNNLKEIGNFIGTSWTSPDASGLQSIIWRYKWEDCEDTNYKKILLTYNSEDCKALKLLVNKLSQIGESPDSYFSVDSAGRPKYSTESGKRIHQQFEIILKSAHANYNKNKIKLRKDEFEGDICEIKKQDKKITKSRKKRKKIPKARTSIQLSQAEVCPKHLEHLKESERIAEKTIIDLVFTKTGVKKTVTRYWGVQAYCSKCGHYISPPGLHKRGCPQLYGHGFQAWVVYNRVSLRLPYRSIIQLMKEQFNVIASVGTLIKFLNYFANYYTVTHEKLIQSLLESPFIHADETTINIEGAEWYVWVFTDGKHVIFKLTETRKATIVHELLSSFNGILISDFYPGYDSVNCIQQKCWVHLIRDLNNDLWINPFDTEFEMFIKEVRNLIVPIFEAIERYGLRKRNLSKFTKHVDTFYKKFIVEKTYQSELVVKYQKRFVRYQNSLFTFLEYNGITWHNNTAENAIRHIAKQRDISGIFYELSTHDYLLLLGIKQTCRFQDKSFLKFLLSGEKDVDRFKSVG